MSKERLRVVDRSLDLSVDDLFDGNSLETIKDSLDSLVALAKRGESALFKVEHYGYDGGADLILEFYRDENDKEYARRMREEEKAREKKRLAKEKREARARKILEESAEQARLTEAAERAEYERLREKFEALDK